ncbi:MAG: L-2-hydroxyglutarate oxidase [Cytophagales bacterium]|nr:MAG: L-2-hydroxyglutarate oxidase [Cytophagales bacterium]
MQYDIIVIGGGIVGLASALKMKVYRPELKILVLEKEKQIAKHQTGNNSGVIHSGIYYKPGSLKAKNCIEGYKELISFCERENIPFELCGKIIVATKKEELPALEQIKQRGIQNGLQNLKNLNSEEIKNFEPHCSGIAGIHVPQTGIVDYKLVAEKYADNFKSLEGNIHLSEKVIDIKRYKDRVELITDKTTYNTKMVVNCAGLFSDRIAALTQKQLPLRIVPFRGEYYELKKEKEYLIKNLIYPVPNPDFPFLGVHFTRRISGGIEAGPNAVWAFKREGYKKYDFNFKDVYDAITWPGFRKVAKKYWRVGFDEIYRSWSKDAFTRALQELVPEVQKDDLVTGGAGVRAQACDKNGGLIDDFLILEEKNIINVCNAPSPAATSSYAIGKYVAQLALKHF